MAVSACCGDVTQTLTDLRNDIVDGVVLEFAGDDDLAAVIPVAVVGLRHTVDVDGVVKVANL